MLIDDAAADFPGMPVILAHPSVPWQDEAISIATHKANVYIDLSGWSPGTSRRSRCARPARTCRTRCCSAPAICCSTPERWLRHFDLLDIKPQVRPKILMLNAVRLLGLGSGG